MGDFGIEDEREEMIEVGRGREVKEAVGNAKDRALLTKSRSILDMIGLDWLFGPGKLTTRKWQLINADRVKSTIEG